ncbi:AAA family ATPase [Plantactinospora sp. KLBMP9567]|uniref:AAA family ATPase n=1 Tax=Plantactinospora sp. KLBMP9567 TaxID=3085900 RepID=UPI002981669A|nr:AAA family ATPase [Plantactinospora sp. KLBMP9567]MDW5323531.1 AAA family ATPase [Plantactinospora sp. KLBMP9567]
MASTSRAREMRRRKSRCWLAERFGAEGSDAAHRRTRSFSTGMRQRLNLAAALLGDPPVLLLDEPGNGLDPEGIAWLRDFLRELAGQGRTVLISSHVLSEVRQMVDDVVVIRGGRQVVAGRLADLVGASGSLEQLFLRLTSTAPDTAGAGDRADVTARQRAAARRLRGGGRGARRRRTPAAGRHLSRANGGQGRSGVEGSAVEAGDQVADPCRR